MRPVVQRFVDIVFRLGFFRKAKTNISVGSRDNPIETYWRKRFWSFQLDNAIGVSQNFHRETKKHARGRVERRACDQCPPPPGDAEERFRHLPVPGKDFFFLLLCLSIGTADRRRTTSDIITIIYNIMYLLFAVYVDDKYEYDMATRSTHYRAPEFSGT